MTKFKKFGDIIIHDCRQRNGLYWGHDGIVIWQHSDGTWYMYHEHDTATGDTIIHYCPLCGNRLDYYFVHKGDDTL